MTSLCPFSLKELESQVSGLEKEATELREAVEQQKVKNNVSAAGTGGDGWARAAQVGPRKVLRCGTCPGLRGGPRLCFYTLLCCGDPGCGGCFCLPLSSTKDPELTACGSACTTRSSVESSLGWGQCAGGLA